MATTHDPLAPVAGETQSNPGQNGGVRSKLSEATSHVKNTAAEFGRSAADTINSNMKSAANALENTASALRRPEGGGRVADIANTTAEKLESTARYFREHDTQDVMRGVENWARSNPGAAIGTAAALGFLLGMTLRRDRRTY